MKLLLTSTLLILSALLFVASANAKTVNTNISGLVIKDLECYLSQYSGRWVNRSNKALGDRVINITMFDSDGDKMGVQSTYSINVGAKTGGDLRVNRITGVTDCESAHSVDISATKP